MDAVLCLSRRPSEDLQPMNPSTDTKHEHDCCGGSKPEVAPPPVAHSCCGASAHSHEEAKSSPVAKYICPMCPGVKSDKPGACPMCGMALERNPAWKPAAKP